MEKNKEELEQEREDLEAKIAEIQRQLDQHDDKRAEQGETVPSPPKPVVEKEKQPANSPKPNVTEEKQAESGEKVHKPLPKARNDWDNSYTQEIIDSIQLKELPSLIPYHVDKYMPNANPRSIVSIGGYKARMIALGMPRDELRKRTDPYIMVVNNLQKKIDDYMEKDNTRFRGQLTGYLVALALGVLIDHERDYLGLFNLDKLEDAIVHIVVRYAKCSSGHIFKNWPSFDEMEVPDYVFSWVENPAYLEPDLYLHMKEI